MGKIAFLVPREEMLYQAHNILQERDQPHMHYETAIMKVVRTKNVVMEARQAIADGASIIIARGLQASLIKQYTDIPVVEIVITAQEMALLIVKAKQILKKEHPVIAVVGFQNMFCDMSYFDSLYGIELHTFFAPDNEMLRPVSLQAVEERADLIIGGEVTVEAATAAGIPSLFLSATEDSIRNAFSMAESIHFAMSADKKRTAQMETLLDYSFSGLVNVDAHGKITALNPMMEDMLGTGRKKAVGHLLTDIFPDLDPREVARVLTEGGNGYPAFLQVRSTSVFALLAPVLIEGRADGAILTCHKMQRKLTLEQESQSKRHSTGFIALGQFSDILQGSPAMQACIHKAKLYALSDLPVLICGEAGTEKRLMAQSIHNAGLRKRSAFVDVSLDGLTDEEQRALLFDEKGAALQADGGTLLLEGIDSLTRSNQYRLLQLIRYRLLCERSLARTRHLDVRVMVTLDRPGLLEQMTASGHFREDLYHLIQGLRVEIPPLHERPEDLMQKLENAIRESCERYDRYHVLTKGAFARLMAYPWPGNLFQVEAFCERLILTAAKRSLDERDVDALLDPPLPPAAPAPLQALQTAAPPQDLSSASTWPQGMPPAAAGPQDMASVAAEPRSMSSVAAGPQGMSPAAAGPQGIPLADPRARQLYEALQRHEGNRMKTAAELGISKATLWRWMKKYGVE